MSTQLQIPPTYFSQRMAILGITEKENQVKLWRYNMDTKQNELQNVPVFKEHPKGIEITPYTLDRHFILIRDNEVLDENGKIIKKAGKTEKWKIIRLEKPIVKDNGDQIKYLMPKGHGSYPLFTPNILDAYDAREEIHTLILTEGFFKAWKGYMAGLYMIGLPSITHMKDKEKKTIHPEIIEVINRCNVKHIIWLTDGDALDISQDLETTDAAGNKQPKDLQKRPYGFYASINTFSQLLYDYKSVRKYFAYIDIDNIIAANPDKFSRNEVKGLDDLLITFPDKQQEITQDITNISKPGQWFNKFDISVHTGKVWEHFHLDNPTRFYLFHLERRLELKGKDFIFNGTQYKYNETTGECDVVVPRRAKDYFRVGDDYYKYLEVPNKYGQIEKQFKGRRKGTIIDDNGKHFINHIPKYEAFCNVPNNVNFQPVINNCFNVYNPLDYRPDEDTCTEEDCPTIISFLMHLFGDRPVSFKHPKTHKVHEYKNIDLALDYLQVLYKYPAEKLPILCLVSKENNTGKSTFGFMLRLIFGSNTTIVGNQDLAGDFNAHWATKLVVICDETKIDKQHVVEKVKSLSTANKITMNAKGKDHVEIDCFIKFIFITNNEENFIYMSDEDIRYWIIKVPVLKEENPHILSNFVEEIPAFLSFLSNRKMQTEQLNRMWFYPTLLKTEAMKKVIEYSKSTVEKEIRQRIKDMFEDFGGSEITMTREAVHKEFFNRKYEANYIKKVLNDDMKVDRFHEFDFNEMDLFGKPKKVYKNKRHSYPKWDEVFKDGSKKVIRVDVEDNGRPYVFRIEQFLTPEEIANINTSPQTVYENEISGSSPVPESGELPF